MANILMSKGNLYLAKIKVQAMFSPKRAIVFEQLVLINVALINYSY